MKRRSLEAVNTVWSGREDLKLHGYLRQGQRGVTCKVINKLTMVEVQEHHDMMNWLIELK